MATTTAVAQPGSPDPTDPYFYGWRDLRRVDAAGQVTWERVPLTREDALHPQEGDHVSQNNVHADHCRYLVDVCALRLADNPSAVVLGDVGIAWGVPGLRPHSPDVAVIVGVRARRYWPTFSVAEERVRPSLIIEVTSPATVENDLTTKVRQYAQVAVAHYVIVDGVTNGPAGPTRLLDYHLVGERYEERAPDERGWVWLGAVGVWLGIVAGAPVCFDEAGQAIGDFTAQAGARAAAEARAEAETARAEAEMARAEAEALARAEAEARVRALEEEVRRLRGHGP